MGNTNSGFTVIEVTLFLAVSASLVLVAIIGTGSLMTSIRFSDSMRSTHAYIQQQYDEILNGVNPRDAERICGATSDVDPGQSGCLLLGKLINFEIGGNNLHTYYVVSTSIPDLSGEDANLSDEELIAKVEPYVVKGSGKMEEYDIPWGASVFDSKRVGGDNKRVNTYALLRSPRSSRLVSYTFNMDRSILAGAGAVALDTEIAPGGANSRKATNFCIESQESQGLPAGVGDLPAKITVASGEGQNAIGLKFDIPVDKQEVECEGA